ncbi:hypothetical protein EYR36_002045 [Pleurotus pulmonarius]|nr:hypothetical protein EYR36_002045 [Pleurotus pulmonarius]KAF4588216.1 hypothetical protein EYR38_010183 [Pleurotus pulmonarius]
MRMPTRSTTQSMRRPTPQAATSQKATKAQSSSNRAKSLPAAAQPSPPKATRTERLLSAAPAKRAASKRKVIAVSTLPSVRSSKPTSQRPAAQRKQTPAAASTMVTRSSARRASAPPEVIMPRKRKVFDAVAIDERQIGVPSARAKRLRIQPPPTAPCLPRKKVFDGVEIPSTRWMTTWVASEVTVRRAQCPPRPSRLSRPSQKKRIGMPWGNLGEDVYSDHVSTPGAELETDSQSVHSDDLVHMGSVDAAQPA